MTQLAAVDVLLAVAGVVLVAIVVGLVLVAALQLGLWLALRSLGRFLEQHAQPAPRRSPTAERRTGARNG